MKVGLELQFFTGNCPEDDNATAEIAADFVERFRELNQLAPGLCEEDTGCSVENVQVSCGPVARRRRRATNTALQIQFTVVVDPAQAQEVFKDSSNLGSEPLLHL